MESGDAGTDLTDSAVVIQTEGVSSCIQTLPGRQELADNNSWKWLGCDNENETNDTERDTQPYVHTKWTPSKSFIVRNVRKFLIVIYCLLYVSLMSIYSDCVGQSHYNHSSTNFQCSWKTKVLRSFRFPLLSIIGVVIIQLVTRLIMFFIALCVWRGAVKQSAIATLGPFQSKMIWIIYLFIVLIVMIYLLSNIAFEEDVAFDELFVELFGVAGIATLITSSMGIEEDTGFEKVFQQQKEQDGYVYGLAHAYFQHSLKPFLKPYKRRYLFNSEWADENPSAALLVLLVESNLLIHQVFKNPDFASDVAFIKESYGTFLMKMKLAEKDEEIKFANFPVLLNEHLLCIEKWFSSKGHTFLPPDEQYLEYINTLRTLVKDEHLPRGGDIGRVCFVRIPDDDIKKIPEILRKALYREVGRPNSAAFNQNTKQAIKSTSLHSIDSAMSSGRSLLHTSGSVNDRDGD